jgi:RNA polymerase sigma factor FliA
LRLRFDLERTSRDLASSLEENARMRSFLAQVLESLPCGVTEANLGGLLFARCPSAPFPDNTQLPLNSEAAMTLQTAPQMDEAHREKTLLEHLPQVQYIARRIHDRLPPQVLLEDLVHAGIIGLIDAVKKYDPSKNVQLKHYAEFRIRGAILDSLRQIDWSPRALRRRARRLEQAILSCKAKLGRDPTEPEIAAELQISLENLQQLLGDLRGLDIGSLQAHTSDGAEEEGSLHRAEREEENPYHQALRSEMNGLLETAIAELPDRERQVLALYHFHFEELTMKEVGEVLGIGESRVSQIHTAALLRLRARMREMLESGPRRTAVSKPKASASMLKTAKGFA